MNWTVQDYLQWEGAKEYIDTVIIPLIPIKWGELEEINDVEYIQRLMVAIEQEYRGRIIVSLPFTYGNETLENRWNRLDDLTESLRGAGLIHVIYLTCDLSWKQDQKDIIFNRPISLNGIKENMLRDLIKIQAELMQDELVKRWNLKY